MNETTKQETSDEESGSRHDRMVTPHFNQLTPAEAERLAVLAEECGEVIQAVGKILRHGYESSHPDGGPTNRRTLEREIGDVLYAVDRIALHDLSSINIENAAAMKKQNIKPYLHHAG